MPKTYNPVKDPIGERFGKLVVVRFHSYRATPRGRRVPMVVCLCDCGRKKTISVWDLRNGKTRTCGYQHPHYEDRSEPAFNIIYNHSYKARALKAGLPFTLSKETFRELTQRNCHYCGSPPTGRSRLGSNTRGAVKSGKYISQYIYNGLDRINSRRGYTKGNVVPCCGTCNHAKHTMSYADFVAWLDKVADARIALRGSLQGATV